MCRCICVNLLSSVHIIILKRYISRHKIHTCTSFPWFVLKRTVEVGCVVKLLMSRDWYAPTWLHGQSCTIIYFYLQRNFTYYASSVITLTHFGKNRTLNDLSSSNYSKPVNCDGCATGGGVLDDGRITAPGNLIVGNYLVDILYPNENIS